MNHCALWAFFFICFFGRVQWTFMRGFAIHSFPHICFSNANLEASTLPEPQVAFHPSFKLTPVESDDCCSHSLSMIRLLYPECIWIYDISLNKGHKRCAGFRQQLQYLSSLSVAKVRWDCSVHLAFFHEDDDEYIAITNYPTILLMDKILHQGWWLSHDS